MIRLFVSDDLEQVMEIWLDVNLEAHGFIPADYWIAAAGQVRRALPEAEIYVWEENGQVLGFVGLQGDYVAGIFVRRRSQGIGRKLLERAKRGRDVLSLHVYEKNEKAVRFYLREGFVLQDRQVQQDTGEQEYRMIWRRQRDASDLRFCTGP